MELFRALAALSEPPATETNNLAQALCLGPVASASEYTELFVFQLYPYASVYLGAEGMLGGEAQDRIAGFWRALDQKPPAEADHLALMLALYARLSELEESEAIQERRQTWANARRAFLWEHLLSWLPVYLEKLEEIAPPFYRGWAEVLTSALLEEASRTGRQQQLSSHLRQSQGLSDPRLEGNALEDFLRSLLIPARSGMIITRADLSRAARALGLVSRLGERKFVLESLFNQDAPGLLGWLIEESRNWTERHRRFSSTLGEISVAWEKKAARASALLQDLYTATAELV